MPYPWKTERDWIAEEEKLGMVYRTKVPIKCGDYNNIVDIGNGIPGKIPETEMRAFARFLHSLPGKPIGIIENPVNNRPDIPVVVNPWPTRERALRGCGVRSNIELCAKIEAIPKKRIKPNIVSKKDALCKGVIIKEPQLDLRKDIPRCWVEFNQWLWTGANGTIILRDPETGAHSLGKCRWGPYEWKNANPETPYPEERIRQYGVATMAKGGPRPSNTGRFYMKHRTQGKTMPCAYVYGLPTDYHILAAVKSLNWPQSGDEYEALGGWRGQPVDIVESETIPGLMVPADAEWVIEGEFLPEDETMPMYCEDQFIGYIVWPGSWPVFKVKCITHRKDPWWDATTFSSSGMHGRDGTHSALATTELEADNLRHLRSLGFPVKDVACLAGPMFTVVQLEVDGLRKPYPYFAKKVGQALASYGSMVVSPYIVVVGPDVDPFDPMDVIWNIAMQSSPMTDSEFVKNGPPGIGMILGIRRDQHRPEMSGEQMILDATQPVPERYDAWRPRSEPRDWEIAAIKRMAEKLGYKK